MLMIKIYALLLPLLVLALVGAIYRGRSLGKGGQGMISGGLKSETDGKDKIRSGRKQKRRSLVYYLLAVPLAYIALRVVLVILTAE